MKKITLLTALLVSFIGFSQSNKAKIQTYLENNRAQFGLTTQDIADWTIESEVPGSGTKITSTYIVQRYQGIEIFNAQSNAWVKDGKVINLTNNFKSNIAQKVNVTSPSLSVIQAITSAYSKLGITKPATFSIVATFSDKAFQLSDGIQEDVINAKLVYQYMSDDKLRLAWTFQFYTPDGDHLWDLRIDALDGKILQKNDLRSNCNFGESQKVKQDVRKNFSFERTLSRNSNSSMLVATPGTYRVIPFNYESPNHHSFDLITTSGNALASPNGWHNVNSAIGGTTATLIYTYTRGNNVLAQEDRDGNNGTGIRADGGATLTFDFPYGGVSANPSTYTSAAITNLFYMNNIMHDVWYQYGFDEASHNFQQVNYGRGGTVTASGDNVQADAQDGAALTAVYSGATTNRNNSNFSTPADGVRPRMQKYIWDAGAPIYNFLTVLSPSSIAGGKASKDNSFDTTDHITIPVTPNGITSDIVLYTNDPVHVGQNPNSACQAPTNGFDIAGKIVLIQRGGCTFSSKVKNAQDAGAIAAVIYDSIPQSATYIGTIGMTSTGVLGITIPAISVNKTVGDALAAEIANGPVSVKLESPGNLFVAVDGDFDNVVVGHEYGHGISGRLIGGGVANCMTNAEQMGEGWSDWFGLMMQIKTGDTGADAKPIGTFVFNEPTNDAGLRSVPYSTDMTICPLTFIDSNVAEVHDLGETWAAVLWDLTWAYIGKYGFDPDIYNGTGGNNKVMRLVLDGLKLQACNTASYISARDNLIAADQATTGGADYCLITDVFTRRGMGLNASSGLATDALDQVEDFTPFPAGPNCTLAVNYFEKNDQFRVYPNPTNGLLNIRINQFVGKVNIQVIDINGRAVFNQNDADFNIEKAINISSLQTGMYVIRVTGNNLNYSQKLIKN